MSLKTLPEKIISSPYHDIIINGMILSVILLLLSPTIYNSFITEPQNVKELKKRGIIIKAYKNRINHIRRSGVFANYYYFVGGRKYNENLYTRDTPHNYSVPDTLDFFYLSEDPWIIRPAYMLFPEYGYSWEDEQKHKVHPTFDVVKRKFVRNDE